MNVFLVRHGDAVSTEEDPQRPLSEEGRQEIIQLIQKLKNSDIEVDRILHSSKSRAVQTAQLLSSELFPEVLPQEVEGLLPDDSFEEWIPKLEQTDDNLMLVGHLPFMGMLTHALLGGERMSEITFVTGTLLWLRKVEDGWQLKDVFHP